MVHSQLACPLFLLCSLLMLPSVLMQGVGIDGGRKPIPVTDKDVKQAAAFAIEQLNERIDCYFYLKELSIVDAQVKKVTEGFIYYLTVELGPTVCGKSKSLSFIEIQKCELNPKYQQKKQTCNFEVLSYRSQKHEQLLNMSCSNSGCA